MWQLDLLVIWQNNVIYGQLFFPNSFLSSGMAYVGTILWAFDPIETHEPHWGHELIASGSHPAFQLIPKVFKCGSGVGSSILECNKMFFYESWFVYMSNHAETEKSIKCYRLL